MRFILMAAGWFLAVYFCWFALSYGYEIPESDQAFDAWWDRINRWTVLASFTLINFAVAALISEPTRLSEKTYSDNYTGHISSGGNVRLSRSTMNDKSFMTIFLWVVLMAVQLGLLFVGPTYDVPLPFGLSAPFTDVWDGLLRD